MSGSEGDASLRRLLFRTHMSTPRVNADMVQFVAIAYPTREAAMDGRLAMIRLAPGHPRDLADAIVASVDDFGTINIDQLANLWSLAPKGRMLREFLFGLLFLYPLVTVLPGEAPRTIAAALLDFGLGELALVRVMQMLKPGQAVVFLLTSPVALPVLASLHAGAIEVQHVDETKVALVISAFDQGQQAANRQQEAVYGRTNLDD